MSKNHSDAPWSNDDTPENLEWNWSQEAQRHYEPNGSGELTTAIIYAIAEAKDISPAELKSPPLYQVIDAPALEDTFFGEMSIVPLDRGLERLNSITKPILSL